MNTKTDYFTRARVTGSGLLRQEESLSTMVLSKGKESKLPLKEIKPRCNPSTRRLDPNHVLDLAESIMVLGLIEAIAVDSNHHLLAGGHRLCALQLLASSHSERIGTWTTNFGSKPDEQFVSRLTDLPTMAESVSVNVIPLDSSSDISRALAIEIAENERRRNFSREEIRGLAERLRAAGFRTERGRARAGEAAVIPALSAVLGKSRATVFRMLREDSAAHEGRTADAPILVPPGAEDRRLVKALQRWLGQSPESLHRDAVDQLIRMLSDRTE